MSTFENISFGRSHLAPFACHGAQSRGRLIAEPESPTRTPYQRDRDRIIHSTAFRRLKHKTQVFVEHVGDHYRTRLTHSIEVSQIARALARALGVDEDLAEALALSHDFGHTPFGHAGEDELDELMRDHGGFDHNAQSLKIVTALEQQYAEFDGLNLSWETLEGLVKHNGPVTGGKIPGYITQFNAIFDLELSSHASIEAQCAAIADDIAYNAHDIDDGLRAGLFSIEDIAHLPIVSETLEHVGLRYPDLEPRRVHHEIIRRQITAMVEDVITTSLQNLARLKPASAQEVRHAGETIVRFSNAMAAKEKMIKSFLFDHMYRSDEVMEVRKRAVTIIADLFAEYASNMHAAPPGLLRYMAIAGADRKTLAISDFIASMTDSYAIKEHQRLFDETPDLG